MITLIRKIVGIAIWAWIAYLLVPRARAKGRSGFRWFLLGILTFFLVAVSVWSVGIFALGALIQRAPGDGPLGPDPGSKIGSIMLAAFAAGVFAVYLLARTLARLPSLAQPASNTLQHLGDTDSPVSGSSRITVGHLQPSDPAGAGRRR